MTKKSPRGTTVKTLPSVTKAPSAQENKKNCSESQSETIIMAEGEPDTESKQKTEQLENTPTISNSMNHEDILAHGQRVSVLAGILFQDTKSLHRLSEDWGHLLHHAARLHDIGMTEGYKGHHKTGMRLIETLDEPELHPHERELVALLVRYHRKAWPTKRHTRFAALKKSEQRAVQALAGLLRLADALDTGQEGESGILAVTVKKQRVILAFPQGEDAAFVRRVIEKGALFSHVFGRHLECISLHS